jgi:hypothetical protein
MKKILLIISIFSFSLNAQNASVFSNTSYGLGLPFHFLSVRAMGMGDAGLAASDSNNLNLYNYSQWAGLKFTQVQLSFSAEQSFYSGVSQDGDLKASGFSGMMLAIPLKMKKLVVFFNLYPTNHLFFSGYSQLGDSLNLPRELYLERKGDAFQLNGGFAYQWDRHFASSIQFLYNLGSYYDQYKMFFTDNTFLNIKYKYEYSLSVMGIGLSQTASFRHTQIGGYFHKYFSGKFERISSKGYDVTQKITRSFSTSMPYEWGIGFAHLFGGTWLLAVDGHYKDYQSGVPTFLDTDSLFSSFFRINLGLEKKSKANRFEPIIKRMIWRVGSFYGSDGYKFHGHELKNYGLTFGVGIPINYFGSRVDLALQLGKRGSKRLNDMEELYIKFGIEFRTFERWFKRFKE